jgi:hypothetical protein
MSYIFSRLSPPSGKAHDAFQSLLWSDGAIPVDPAASKEAVMHHALAKQKKNHDQEDDKQEFCDSGPA